MIYNFYVIFDQETNDFWNGSANGDRQAKILHNKLIAMPGVKEWQTRGIKERGQKNFNTSYIYDNFPKKLKSQIQNMGFVQV
jgi:hypothetical protein